MLFRSFQPDARVGEREQDVADQRADQGQRADQQHEGAGEIHVLAHQRLQQQRARRRQAQHDGDDDRAGDQVRQQPGDGRDEGIQ